MIPAKYAGVCPDCKKEYSIKTNIERNKRTHWCMDGEKCSLKDATQQKKPEEIEQEKLNNQKQRLDSQVNDQTAEITAKGIKKILHACWKEAYDDGETIIKELGMGDFTTTMILSQVFFKEYGAIYREMMRKSVKG